MKRFLLTMATSVAFASSLIMPAATRAQAPVQLAQSGLDCNVVESLGTALSASILDGVNNRCYSMALDKLRTYILATCKYFVNIRQKYLKIHLQSRIFTESNNMHLTIRTIPRQRLFERGLEAPRKRNYFSNRGKSYV